MDWSIWLKYDTFVDEVGALVFDVGHHSFRAGYAGEDTPKTEIPSYVGVAEIESGTPMDIDGPNGNGLGLGNDVKTPRKKYTIDTVNLHVPKAGNELIKFGVICCEVAKQ